MKHLVGMFAAIFVSWTSGFAMAGDRPVVVELFTSQGCSSCPPADALMHDLSKRDDVIVLALHVDYWDYIGWKDVFAQPAFTQRQRNYAKAQGERMVYTPQMMINGRQHVVGNRKSEVLSLIKTHSDMDDVLDVKATANAGRLKIEVSNSQIKTPMMVHVVALRDKATVAIKRGENAGRTITYKNIVTDWRTIGEWDGRATASFTPALPKGGDHYVVIVQQKNYGEILAAYPLR